MLKKISIFCSVALFVAVSTTVNASSRWTVKVEDDLFSDTGEKALLVSSGHQRFLFFQCENSNLEMAFLESSRQTFNDSSAFGSAPIKLIIKVDDNKPVNFEASFNRRNDHYVQASKDFKYSESSEFLPLLEQIAAARSKILVGLDGGGDRKHSTTIGVSGSTAATNRFLDSCGLRK